MAVTLAAVGRVDGRVSGPPLTDDDVLRGELRHGPGPRRRQNGAVPCCRRLPDYRVADPWREENDSASPRLGAAALGARRRRRAAPARGAATGQGGGECRRGGARARAPWGGPSAPGGRRP